MIFEKTKEIMLKGINRYSEQYGTEKSNVSNPNNC